jgi:thymidylate kinase
VAQITDLIVRRLARGKTVDPARLDEARSAWQEMGPDERRKADQHFARRFGARTGASILDLLEGREPPESVGRALRMQVCGACLISFSGMTTAASKIVSGAAGWLTRRPRPFGQYVTGAVVVISGTDGVGKSTTLENVANELQAHGMRCTTVYLGRGRGNVPGVATLRDLVSRKVLKGHAAKDVYRKPTVNKLASWLYAFEYFLRTLWPRFLVRFPGHVVLCDRYCYDIGLIPGASTWAIRFARFLCPRPAMNVLLQAPPDVILQRKAERSLEEIQKQQAVLSRIIENRYARQISMTIDTSETDITGTCDKIAGSIYQLTHRDFT